MILSCPHKREPRCQFNGGTGAIKLATARVRPIGGLEIDVHQDFYVVVNAGGWWQLQAAAAFSKTSVSALGG
jgi:hypothetical protein